MTYAQLVQARYSVRKFETRPVEDELLRQVLEAGRAAPTAKNLQPQRIYVLKSEEALEKIRSITKMTFHAPVVLLVCGDTSEGWVNPFNDRNSTEMDASIVTTHMMLQAADLGLGSTWVCWFDTQKVKEAFALPEQIEPFCLLPLGYPSAAAAPAPLHEQRKPLEETVAIL